MKTVLKLLVISAIISPSIALAKPIRTFGPHIVSKEVKKKEHDNANSTESVGSDDNKAIAVKHQSTSN